MSTQIEKPLFTVEPANDCLSVVLEDHTQLRMLLSVVNFEPLINQWQVLDFTFESAGKGATNVPDICTVYVSGILGLQARHSEVIFPKPHKGFELLPIRVKGEPWYLINCLSTASVYDESASIVLRGEDRRIYFVQRLVASECAFKCGELCTLADSNRAQLFVTDAFRERILRLKLKGLRFRKIGAIRPV